MILSESQEKGTHIFIHISFKIIELVSISVIISEQNKIIETIYVIEYSLESSKHFRSYSVYCNLSTKINENWKV